MLFQNPQVKLVISGHYHFPAAVLKDGTHHITVPTVITYPCKYALFTVTSERVQVEMVPIQDKALVKQAKEELVKADDWRIRFRLDHHMINLFKGINFYSFEPRE